VEETLTILGCCEPVGEDGLPRCENNYPVAMNVCYVLHQIHSVLHIAYSTGRYDVHRVNLGRDGATL
jgi:hypothetical protein